jgi:hypothetical protein
MLHADRRARGVESVEIGQMEKWRSEMGINEHRCYTHADVFWRHQDRITLARWKAIPRLRRFRRRDRCLPHQFFLACSGRLRFCRYSRMGLRMEGFFHPLGKIFAATGALRRADQPDHRRLRCAADFPPRSQGQDCPRKCNFALHSAHLAISCRHAFQDRGRPHRLDLRNPADDLMEGFLIADPIGFMTDPAYRPIPAAG